jgi:hypothetical protein
MDLAGHSTYKNEKWKWLFMNGCEWRGLIHAVTELLNFCQDGTNVTVRPGTILKNYTSME